MAIVIEPLGKRHDRAAIDVDAKDEHAVVFYERFGFRRFPARPRRLFLLTSTAVEAFARASE